MTITMKSSTENAWTYRPWERISRYWHPICAFAFRWRSSLNRPLRKCPRRAALSPRVEPMDVDAKVCYCFHVSRRKLVNFVRREKPKVPSQLSLCGGAGTGCGWCIPFIKQIFEQAVKGGETELERLTPVEYESRRAQYIRAGKGTPPAGATPL